MANKCIFDRSIRSENRYRNFSFTQGKPIVKKKIGVIKAGLPGKKPFYRLVSFGFNDEGKIQEKKIYGAFPSRKEAIKNIRKNC